MKFFLKQYIAWYNDMSDEETEAYLAEDRRVHTAYRDHLESIRAQLPQEVFEIADPFFVDDALVARVARDTELQRLTLTLRCGCLPDGYFDLVVTYDGVEMSEEHDSALLSIAKNTLSDCEFQNDCDCQEIDVLDDGRIEHRMLFNDFAGDGDGYVWFAIRCKQMSIQRVACPDRSIPPLSERL